MQVEGLKVRKLIGRCANASPDFVLFFIFYLQLIFQVKKELPDSGSSFALVKVLGFFVDQLVLLEGNVEVGLAVALQAAGVEPEDHVRIGIVRF